MGWMTTERKRTCTIIMNIDKESNPEPISSVERRKRRVLFSLLLTLYSWQMERFSQVMRSLMAKGRPVDSRRVSYMK